MSQVKRLIEKQEAQHDAAISIAVAGGSLKRCEWHPDIVMDAGEVDHSYAYRVGNAKLKAGELGDLFDSLREMTDAVKAAIDEHALDYARGATNCSKTKASNGAIRDSVTRAWNARCGNMLTDIYECKQNDATSRERRSTSRSR